MWFERSEMPGGIGEAIGNLKAKRAAVAAVFRV
jgi:hypothetical protein